MSESATGGWTSDVTRAVALRSASVVGTRSATGTGGNDTRAGWSGNRRAMCASGISGGQCGTIRRTAGGARARSLASRRDSTIPRVLSITGESSRTATEPWSSTRAGEASGSAPPLERSG